MMYEDYSPTIVVFMAGLWSLFFIIIPEIRRIRKERREKREQEKQNEQS